jgi:hypothetical protein
MIECVSGLVTLTEFMYKLDVCDIAFLMASFEATRGGVTLTDAIKPGQNAPEEAVSKLLRNLETLEAFAESLQLDQALKTQICLLVANIKGGKADLRPNAISADLKHICTGLYSNLKTRCFLFVPADKAKHYMNINTFGVAPFVFIEAVPDMLDAGNCYATDLATACVFHLMRVSEHGLRALARKLRVSLKDRGKPCPIEHATWNKVLDAIDNKIKKAREKSAGPKKNEELKFYSDAASHCRHIRDIWRNEVSHTRTRYNEHEAFAAMNRIADFMQLLAEGLYTEEQRTKIIIANMVKHPTPPNPELKLKLDTLATLSS